jgi:hypothetical protein
MILSQREKIYLDTKRKTIIYDYEKLDIKSKSRKSDS